MAVPIPAEAEHERDPMPVALVVVKPHDEGEWRDPFYQTTVNRSQHRLVTPAHIALCWDDHADPLWTLETRQTGATLKPWSAT